MKRCYPIFSMHLFTWNRPLCRFNMITETLYTINMYFRFKKVTIAKLRIFRAIVRHFICTCIIVSIIRSHQGLSTATNLQYTFNYIFTISLSLQPRNNPLQRDERIKSCD